MAFKPSATIRPRSIFSSAPPTDRERERGAYHADPSIGIRWPLEVTSLSDRDRKLPSLGDAELS